MSATIHPTAIVSPQAHLEDSVEIGPYCRVEGNVFIGEGTILESHAFIDRNTTLGKGNWVGHGVVLGTPPQDKKFDPTSNTYLVIGDNNTFREYATVSRATGEGQSTIIGSGCMLMTTSHVGHNCFVGDEVILSNVVLLAGHVQIHDWCIIGGNVALPQYLRMGKGTFMGGFSAIRQDLPPFFRASGLPGGPAGINRVGMARRGISDEAIAAMHQAYKILYLKKLPLESALEKIDNDFGRFAEIQTLIHFIRTSKLGIVRPRSDRGVR